MSKRGGCVNFSCKFQHQMSAYFQWYLSSSGSDKRRFLGDLNTALIFPQNALKYLLKLSFETFYPKSQFQIGFQETALGRLIIETD